jgi:transposase InsO family protein
VDLGKVEQRYKAVKEVIEDGASVSDVAMRYGVVRQTVHDWLRRYAADGMAGLADKSSRPARCPHQMAPTTEARIIELRRANPGWGPRSIHSRLRQDGIEPLVSRSAIYRALIRNNLISPTPRKRKRSDYLRWERMRPMELWQMDVMGRVKIKDGTECSVVTGIDDHSRYCISAKVVRRATAKPVCEALTEAINRYGLPEIVLTDNGKVFTGRFGRVKGEVLFDRICRENGIRHILTAPYSPTTTGKVERMHKTMRSELLNNAVFESVEDAQIAVDNWAYHYNHHRPHQGIGDVAPIERFKLASPQFPELGPPEPDVVAEQVLLGPGMITRKINRSGYVAIASVKYHVGKWLAGQTAVITTSNRLVTITHNGVIIATHPQRHDLGKRSIPTASPNRIPRPATTGNPVIRRADGSGTVSFAGFNYRTGLANKRKLVEVRIVGNKVQFSVDGKVVRVHPIKHDRSKEYGAFAFPKGKARKPTVA